MDAKAAAYQFAITEQIANMNADGISHENSLARVDSGNCMNWVMGHIVRSRNQLLGVVGQEPPYSDDKLSVYSGDPEQPWNADNLLRFDEVMEMFHTLQKPLQNGIDALTPERLASKAPFSPGGNPNETVGSLVTTFAFHEAYHVGQMGILRRVAGKPGAITPPKESL